MTPDSRDPAPVSEREAIRSITARPLEYGPGPRWKTIAIVAVGLAVAGIAYGLVERSRRGSLERDRIAAAARGDSLSAALAGRDSLLAGRPPVEDLLAILAAPDVAAFPLAGGGNARGSLIASSGGAILSANGLPSSRETTYALWHVDDAGSHHVVDLGRAPDGRVFALLDDAGFATGWGAILIGRGGGAATGPDEILLQYRGFLR